MAMVEHQGHDDDLDLDLDLGFFLNSEKYVWGVGDNFATASLLRLACAGALAVAYFGSLAVSFFLVVVVLDRET
jgi:hypothetical protein